ncbi:MAG: hypothetical protein ABIR54_22330 [Burkholderiaceae bacterium]
MSNGFNSYQVGQDDPQTQTQAPQGARVNVRDTVNYTTLSDGVITERTTGHTKGSTAELNPYHGTDSFGASAKNPNGSPVTELLSTTLVTIDGVQAPVSFWVSEGKLQKASDGSFVEAGTQAVQAPQADGSDIFAANPQTMDAINQALEPLPQESLDGLIATGMGIAAGRLDGASLATKFAQMTGLEVADSEQRVDVLRTAYQRQADNALTDPARSGLSVGDLPAFYQWCRDNRQGQLQESIQKQVRTHDVSGYRALADQWRVAVPPSIDAFKRAGVPTRMQGQSPEVFLRGQWMTPGAAAKARLV